MLEDLAVKMNNLQKSIDNSKQTSVPSPTNDNDSRVLTNLEECVRSARRMVSSAVSIISARSVRESQIGSDLGEQLTEQQRTRIQEWIPPPTILEDAEDENPPTVPDDAKNELNNNVSAISSNIGSVSSPEPFPDLIGERQPETSVTTLSERIAEVSTTDPHLDLELKLIRNWRKVASNSFEAKDYSDAEKYLKGVMDRSESTLGSKFDWRSEVVGLLAVVYCHLSKLEEAEKLLVEPFAQKQEVLRTLAYTYHRIGNWQKAENIIDDPNCSARDEVLRDLIIEFCKAENWIGVAMVSRKSFGGRDTALELLANKFCQNEQAACAEKLLEEEFNGRETVMHTLGLYYFQIRDLDNAERMCRLQLSGNDPEEPNLRAMHSLAEVMLEQEKLDEAEEWALKAMRGRKSVLGMEHILFYQSANLLVAVYEAKYEFVEAAGYKGFLPSEFKGTFSMP